jgi:sugar phosphate isomerase/epimerase
MISRRKFITSSAATAAIAVAGPLSFASVSGFNRGNDKLDKFGFISGIIDKELKGDWQSILKQAASFGFSEIETGEYLGESASSFLSFCSSIGLKPVAGGISISARDEELIKQLNALNDLGVQYAVVYWPWLSGGPFSLDDCRKSVSILNYLGTECEKKGLILCWHNHNKEFIPMEEGLPFDYIMDHTDPDTVKCEMDIYWVRKGGGDPLALLKKYRGRYAILHVKDMAPGTEGDFECPGSGIIDFPAIFREAKIQGIQHYMVERDNVPDGMACLRSSGEYLRSLRF